MEPLGRLLFEQPYVQALIAGAAVAVAFLGWWWAKREGTDARAWRCALGVIVLVGLAGQLTQWAVVTDREQIRAVLDGVAVALTKADARAIVEVTDVGLVADGRTQEQFTRWLERTLERYAIRTPSIQRFEVEFPVRDAATVLVAGIATVEAEGFKQVVSGTWRIEFSRIDGQWKIVMLEPARDPQRFL